MVVADHMKKEIISTADNCMQLQVCTCVRDVCYHLAKHFGTALVVSYDGLMIKATIELENGLCSDI